MPPRSAPSERQRRLGAELRKLRTRAGLSGDQAAALLDADRSRISNIEAGRLDVPRNRLYKLLRAYGCSEGPLFEGLMEMAQERGKGWWDTYRDVMGRSALDLAELESRSLGVRMHEPLFVPGLLQAENYMRAIFESATEGSVEYTDRHVEFRLARQRVLHDDPCIAYHAIIHEAALRTRVDGPKVMRNQLLKLIELCRLPNVTVQIFPFEAGAYSAFSRSFAVFAGRTPELDAVRLEHPLEFVVHWDDRTVREYIRMFDRLAALSLPPIDPESSPESRDVRDSLGLVQHVMYEL